MAKVPAAARLSQCSPPNAVLTALAAVAQLNLVDLALENNAPAKARKLLDAAAAQVIFGALCACVYVGVRHSRVHTQSACVHTELGHRHCL